MIVLSPRWAPESVTQTLLITRMPAMQGEWSRYSKERPCVLWEGWKVHSQASCCGAGLRLGSYQLH